MFDILKAVRETAAAKAGAVPSRKPAKLRPELIRLRFFGNRTQTETARILGSTQVQISRRERKILAWMRVQLLEI